MNDSTRPVASGGRQRLVHGWRLCATPPGVGQTPARPAATALGPWLDLPELGPVAAVLQALGQWQLDGAPRRFDAEDWWYRLDFQAPVAAPGESLWLGFDGLATVADVWLNDEPLLSSSNMFVAHAVDVGARMRRGGNSLMLRFHALDSLLTQKRARPRWRAPMIEQQQLRWWRTTVLGRTPGWSPPAAVVGPWKDVWLELRRGPVVGVGQLQATLAGSEGRVSLRCTVEPPPGRAVAQAWLEVSRGGRVHRASLSGDGADFIGTVDVPDAAPWWPHTHGEPARYRCRLQVMLDGSDTMQVTELASVGFRSIELDATGGRLAMRVNGVPVFCRGACWAPLDAVTLRATPQASRDAVLQAREAGMNMLRVGGTMVYEDAAFFDACDELGMLVWQEFMFANLDYPEHDAAFMASVETEVRQQLALWQGRPSLAVVCGNSEVEQQAAMWGAPRELWQPALFHTTLPQWVNESLPGVPYWPSSAHGGSFPHQGNAGSTSYYGVGAYLRPLEDARRSELSFATECLAFANVPEGATVARMPGGHALKAHHAAWKMRAPRDLGAGWDFEDVRDHYLARLYRVDPVRLRGVDHDRYLALSRAVTGEVMSAAFAEWRRPGSRCGGALVWTLRDLWAGAGWGLLDDTGLPKACFHYLRRALQPVALNITDEGCNGLALHLVNERSEALEGALDLALYGPGDVLVTRVTRNIHVEPRGGVTLAVGDWLDGFLDVSYAYRFGPPPATLVVASLQLPTHADPIQAFHFPDGLPSAVVPDLGLSASAEATADGGFVLTLETARFAQTVHIESDSHACDDNDFHMAPESRRRIVLRSRNAPKTLPLKTSIRALNAERVIALRSPT